MAKKEIVTIDKIIPGGSGLGRLNDGMVVMVPKVLPGEKIVAAIKRQKKKYAQGELLEVLDASPLRVTPPCPYFKKCGGCDFQHMSYPEQLCVKEELLREQLSGGIALDHFSEHIAEAREPMAYRQRLKFQVDSSGQVGFFQKNSHEIVPVSACMLAEPQLNEVLEYLLGNRDMALLLRHSETIELILSPDEQRVIVRLHFLRKPRPRDKTLALEIVQRDPNIKSLMLCPSGMAEVGPFVNDGFSEAEKEGASRVCFSIGLSDGASFPMSLEAGGFCQVNRRQNETLIQTMLNWAKIEEGTTLLDLYCGMGNFSIPAVLQGAQVVGMDIQRSAIRSAERNALQNGLVNCHFIAQDAEKSAKEFADSGRSFEIVLLDPPRQGCRAVLASLSQIAANRIIYISCDPATLKRDLLDITASGFQIEKIQGVDMFPQTHHLETIVLLQKI